MSKYYFAYLTIPLLMLGACKSKNAGDLSQPVVAIEEKVLTQHQLFDAIPDGLGQEDSTIFAQNYINRWVKSQLMLRKAELNLTPEEKNIERLIEEYRTSLLTHHYQQKLIEQKYAPMITSSDMEAYYKTMTDNFKLSKPIVKGLFIKIARTAPNLQTLEKLVRSNRPSDLVELEAYCFQNAKAFESFFDDWRSIDAILSQLPREAQSQTKQIIGQKYFNTSDDQYEYYVSISDLMDEGELAPFEFVKGSIRSILLNKKRIEFVKQIEEEIYEEGLKQKVVKFY
jgi:hypothetical protein